MNLLFTHGVEKKILKINQNIRKRIFDKCFNIFSRATFKQIEDKISAD